MKIIDLLNKIANGEIETFYKFKYRNKIVNIEFLIDNYLFLEILNDEIEFIEDTSKEEKKIPEKLDDFNLTTYSRDDEDLGLELNYTGVSNTFNDVYFKINEIIDYLKSKGDKKV